MDFLRTPPQCDRIAAALCGILLDPARVLPRRHRHRRRGILASSSSSRGRRRGRVSCPNPPLAPAFPIYWARSHVSERLRLPCLAPSLLSPAPACVSNHALPLVSGPNVPAPAILYYFVSFFLPTTHIL